MPQDLLVRVAAYIEDHRLLRPAGQKIGVAVSGGADSVVLFHILQRLRSQFALNLHVLHVNHHLRAAESDADEAFVRTLADVHGIPINVQHTPAPSSQIEQTARQMRRAFFKRSLAEHNLQAIALGHNRSDQAETVLFRFLRGSGVTGLAGIRPITRDRLIRPLLFATREEIRSWANSEGLSWREDASNLDTAFTRNRLRLETIPALVQTFNPNLESLLAQSAELAQTEEDYWHTQIQAIYSQTVENSRFGLQLSVPQFAALHLAVRRRLLRQALTAVRGNLNAIDCEHIESILRLCASTEGHNRVIVPGVDAFRSFDRLLLSPVDRRSAEERDYQIPLKLGEEVELPYQTGFLSVQLMKSDGSDDICGNFKGVPPKKVEICDWDCDLLAQSGTLPFLCVRNWRPGDVFQQVGHHSVEKIKALFQAGKVLLWERKHWPVVQAGDEIVWVRQFGGAATVTAADRSRPFIRLIYRQA